MQAFFLFLSRNVGGKEQLENGDRVRKAAERVSRSSIYTIGTLHAVLRYQEIIAWRRH